MINAQLVFSRDPFKVLDRVKDSIKRRILRTAIRKACIPIKKDVKNAAPKRSGALKVSIGSKIWAARKGAVVVGIVGGKSAYTRVFQGRTIRPSRYLHLAERSKPFLKPTLENHVNQYTQIVLSVVKAEIEKEFAKGGK